MNEISFDRRLSHAYIITAPDRSARERTARRLAAAMLCSGTGKLPCGSCRHCRKAFAGIHPDLIVVERDRDDKGSYKREMQVDKIRTIVADAAIMPNEADRKVYLILDADTMNKNAQNALLKVLEEPPAGVCLILSAESADALLETVRSRCVELNENTETPPADPETLERAKIYLQLAAAGDLPGLLRHLTALEKLRQDAVLAFVEQAQVLATDMLCGKIPDEGLSPARLLALTDLMQQSAKYLRSNVGLKHVLGLLAAETL